MTGFTPKACVKAVFKAAQAQLVAALAAAQSHLAEIEQTAGTDEEVAAAMEEGRPVPSRAALAALRERVPRCSHA